MSKEDYRQAWRDLGATKHRPYKFAQLGSPADVAKMADAEILANKLFSKHSVNSLQKRDTLTRRHRNHL